MQDVQVTKLLGWYNVYIEGSQLITSKILYFFL